MVFVLHTSIYQHVLWSCHQGNILAVSVTSAQQLNAECVTEINVSTSFFEMWPALYACAAHNKRCVSSCCLKSMDLCLWSIYVSVEHLCVCRPRLYVWFLM